jgi:hypothetical protein
MNTMKRATIILILTVLASVNHGCAWYGRTDPTSRPQWHLGTRPKASANPFLP